MSDFVLDASITLALYLPATAAQREYAINVYTLARNGAVPAVPSLFAMEVGSVLIRCRRKRLITADRLEHALEEIDALDYEVHHLPYTVPWVVGAAKGYMLQGYDAIYFELAKRLDIPLASLDKGHRTACKSHGVPPLSF